MALSEQEKQMLAEIERALIAEDPRFAQGGDDATPTGVRFDIRSVSLIMLGICLLVGGIALAQVSLWFVILSVAGFLVMLGGGMIALNNGDSPAPAKSTKPRRVSAGGAVRQGDGGLGDRMEDKFRKRFER